MERFTSPERSPLPDAEIARHSHAVEEVVRKMLGL
jgi:hypothetical protein